jgi:hypothetical protein
MENDHYLKNHHGDRSAIACQTTQRGTLMTPRSKPFVFDEVLLDSPIKPMLQ